MQILLTNKITYNHSFVNLILKLKTLWWSGYHEKLLLLLKLKNTHKKYPESITQVKCDRKIYWLYILPTFTLHSCLRFHIPKVSLSYTQHNKTQNHEWEQRTNDRQAHRYAHLKRGLKHRLNIMPLLIGCHACSNRDFREIKMLGWQQRFKHDIKFTSSWRCENAQIGVVYRTWTVLRLPSRLKIIYSLCFIWQIILFELGFTYIYDNFHPLLLVVYWIVLATWMAVYKNKASVSLAGIE